MPTTALVTTNLLVVDPRPDDYLQLAAEATEFRLVYAASGDEALRLPRKSPGGLWLINTQLPDMTGVELLSQVRSRDPGAVCILIGDSYSEADEISVRQLGAILYGCKPPQAAWLRAFPAAQRPSFRDHFAHGPPKTRFPLTDLRTADLGASLRCKPES